MAVGLLPISNDVGIELGEHQSNIRMMSGYTIFKGVRVQSGGQRFNIIMTTAMLKLSGYIIFNNLQDEGHYWQTRVLLSLKSCEYSDVCSGASRHQPDILLKLLN